MTPSPEQAEMAERSTEATVSGEFSKFRVLQVGKFYPPHMGGIETHLQALCGELRRTLDVNVVVASDGREGVEETRDGVRISRLPTPLTLAAAPLCPGMVHKIGHSDADLVHIHLPNPTAVLACLASGYRGPVVVTYHSDTVRQKVLGPLFSPFLHRILQRSAGIIATSPNYLNTSPVLARHTDRCHVIPYGIALDEFAHADSSVVSGLRERYGDRLIISVGRLVYYKGFEYLIRAMRKVRGKLLIVGDGPLREKLNSLAAELDLKDKVILPGEIQNDQMPPYYHAAKVFALASIARSEAFGIVQIEAMAAGLPVVNTSLDSGVPFVSLHEQTGLTVPPADPDALAAALNRLLDDEDLRQSLGRAAIVRAQQQFSLEAMTSKTLALYESVLGR
jgi:glycosyltransferase involved in cell wall biosynthesis